MKYRKRPQLTEATQWFTNGDHPQDDSTPIDRPEGGPQRLSEGKVVEYFNRPKIPGGRFCPDCGNPFQKHGIVVSQHGEEQVVCPGDYIVTHPKGHYYCVKREEFETMFELYEEPPI